MRQRADPNRRLAYTRHEVFWGQGRLRARLTVARLPAGTDGLRLRTTDTIQPQGKRMSLFESTASKAAGEGLLRPKRLVELWGKVTLLGPASPHWQKVVTARTYHVRLWGPPDTGKPTIARLVAKEAGIEFTQMSAVSAEIAYLRKVIEGAPAAFEPQAGRQTAPLQRRNCIASIGRNARTRCCRISRWHARSDRRQTTENPSFSLCCEFCLAPGFSTAGGSNR